MPANKPLAIPKTRGLPADLRAGRLLAARTFRPGAMPRFAILMGHWDAGALVSGYARAAAKKKRKKGKRNG